MYSLDVIKTSIAGMSDDQLIQRYQDGLFSEEAHFLAEAELQHRQISLSKPPDGCATKQKKQGTGSLSVLALLLAQYFFAFLAIWQIFTLWPALSWLHYPDQVPLGSWLNVGIKIFVLLISAALWLYLGKVRPRVRAWSQRSR